MSDPFETLKHLDQEPARPALPASEVRRRGDRMRRRRAVMQVAGATLAVVTVLGGGLALGGELTDGARPVPPPASQGPSPVEPKPEGDWRTTIPAGFPLDQGFPSADFSETELTPPGPEVKVFTRLTACLRQVFPTIEPKDRLGTLFTQPEDVRPRLLTTYADDTEAHGVLTAIVNGYTGCARESYGGVPETVATNDVRETALGDESYVVVRTFSSDGLPTVGLEQIQVVRVGNALLLMSTSNEGGGSKAAIDRHVEEQTEQTEVIVEDMCLFSAVGCTPRPEPVEEPTGLDRALIDVETVRDLTTELATDWAEAPSSDDPTLDCQSAYLATLGARDAAYREFQGRGANGTANAEAATAVLQFTDEAQATDAFETVDGWLRSCQDRMGGTRPVSVAHDPVSQGTGFGPATWRVVEGPAPEICTECDTGWIDAQGVALVGDRLALLSIAYTGDMLSGADTASSPMNDGIEALAREAAASPSPADGLFGPQGMADVDLGSYTWEAPTASLVRTVPGNGPCEGVIVKSLEGKPTGDVDGYASENQGVMALFARDGMVTPEGIVLGATDQDVAAAYQGVEKRVNGWVAPVSGFPDRTWLFGFDSGTLVELGLALKTQSCFG